MFDIVIGHMTGDTYRERNLRYVLSYYQKKCPASTLIVVEQRTRTDLSMYPQVRHICVDIGENSYSRALGFNVGMQHLSKPMALTVDNDCILDPRVIQNLPLYLGSSEAFIPYNICYDLNPNQTNELLSSGRVIGGTPRGGVNACIGGGMFISKRAFEEVGGYEPMSGWGAEDEILFYKLRALVGIQRIKGKFPLFHLFHPSASTKEYLTSPRYHRNLEILSKIKSMRTEDMKGNISEWRFDKNIDVSTY